MAKLSNALQESYVAQGLALGVLAADVEWLPSAKLDFEFALNHAWRAFPGARRFPRVGHPHAADPYYAVLRKSERRKGPLLAAWDIAGPGLVPYVWHDGWSVQESGEMLAGWSDVPWPAWLQLGSDLVSWYSERDKLTPPEDDE
jgi:hypothetical protein